MQPPCLWRGQKPAQTPDQPPPVFGEQIEVRVSGGRPMMNTQREEVLDLASDKEPKAGGYVKYETRVTIKGNPKHLVLATYDPLSGKVATSEVDVP